MTDSRLPHGFIATAAALLISGAVSAFATDESTTAMTYQVPDQALVDIVDAPREPSVRVSPNRQWLLIAHPQALPTIAELAEPELRIAGVRIKPRTNGSSRRWSAIKMSLKDLQTGTLREISGLPDGARLEEPEWAPDSSRLAFTVTDKNEIQLWAADVETASARRVLDASLNATLVLPFKWISDSRHLVAATVPSHRGVAPLEPLVPAGPIVQESLGKRAAAPTFQDLLENPHDEELFEHYMTAQLVRVSINGDTQMLGQPGIVAGYDSSPDGRFVLVETLHRPYSYLVRYSRFPRLVEIRDLDGNLVHQVADLPLHEEVPVTYGSVPTGPREFEWRPNRPASLYWAEALDGGDAGAEADERDRLFMLPAPFDGEPQPFATLALRYAEVEWTDTGEGLAWEWWWQSRQLRTWVVDPEQPDGEAELLWDRSFQDRYNDPGQPFTHWNQWGRNVITTIEGSKSLILHGEGASPDGDRPFVDRLDLVSRESTRLWRSEAPFYEEASAMLDREGHKVLTRREAVDEPPNYFIRNLETGELEKVTDFPHPYPQLKGIQKELVKYQRADELQLTGTLYLPQGYKSEDGPLPVIMWAYPTEYKSAADAGQVKDSPYRFNRIGWWSPLVWLTQGYAVLDDPSLPVVGEGDEEPNDTYVDQLVAGAQAAVDEMVRRSVGDPERMTIAGHSYGAFMAANLLSHSDLFRAGIARSGAYNRTLTPFGFQAEERTFWEAPEIYFAMSPFMHAEQMNEPLLLIHGEVDNNSGTFPLQSKRYYNALKGLGATVRLVMLPHESHGYRARESVLHVMWETNRWMDQYVKSAEPRTETREDH
ncbi:MAG: prolyl oligopeptidase family serine peptidase [Thermoanaerobaculia bacterium]